MKIHAGKFYKTRSGAIAYVAATRCPFPQRAQHPRHTCIGWMVCGDDDYATQECWHNDGIYTHDRHETGLDLVAEHVFECKEGCGAIHSPNMFTPINREGPYCPECLERESEHEAEDASQFGVGA